MKWSFSLGRVFGIKLEVHITFFLILLFFLLMYLGRGESLLTALMGCVLVLAIFGCVVLHELGHALTARRYGIKTRDITLYPIGGVARLERMPKKPVHELWVALAGPAVNVVIALILAVVVFGTGSWLPLTKENVQSVADVPFWQELMLVNIFLVLFNLLPAFPMDGGRVLRALLAMVFPYSRATVVAALCGQAMALVFAIVGLMIWNPFLIFIAIFVWFGAAQESNMVRMMSSLQGVKVRDAMITEFHELHPDSLLSTVVELILAGTQHDFPVVSEGRMVGILTRKELMRALSEHGREARVHEVMETEFPRAQAYERLETVLTRLQGVQWNMVPIIQGDEIVGLLTMENIGEYVTIQNALRRQEGEDPIAVQNLTEER